MEPTSLSGAIVNSLLRRVVEPLVGDDPDSMYFCIGGKVVKYGMWESALVTGLSFKGSDVIHPRGCAGSELISMYFPGQISIKLEELSRMFNSVEQSMNKVKLGLVLLVQGVLMGTEYTKDVKLAYFHMVENIKEFNKFPWGKLCHRRMLKCFRTVVSGKNEMEQIRKSRTNLKGTAAIAGHESFKSSYHLYGFPYAFQVWAFESIPLLRKRFANKLKSKQLPRVLHYHCTTPKSSAVESILTSKKFEVLACIEPTEEEMASKHMGSVLLMSVDLSESEDDDEDKSEEIKILSKMQSANEDWEAVKDKDDGAETQAPQSRSNQDSQLLREVFTQVKELTSKVSRMDEHMSKLKDNDNHNCQASINMVKELTSKVSRMDKEMSKLKDGHNCNNQASIEMLEVIDEDERLKGLANDLGEEVYEAIITVLSEMNDYSPSGRYSVPEWRSFRNGGMEILKEVASLTLEQWRNLKKRFENDKEIKSLETKMKEMEYENKNLMYQNDELRKHYNEEINKMRRDHKNHLERINREHEDLKSEMESQRKEREVPEMVLRIPAEKKRIEEDLLKEKEMSEKLEKTERQHEYLEDLNQILIAKERKSNDELQEARNELTRELKEMSSRAFIGVKRMGELEMKPFYDMCKRKYHSDEAYVKAVEICTFWEACLRDPHWHPFKIIEVGNTYEETINEDDEKLRGLRNEFGEEVYRAVTTAIMEMNEYNASGRFVVSELWNFRERRKASLKEVVSHLLKQVKTLKRKRT
ncbi:factor of DNA methylation 1-like [Papaver somniferum]|uniref:factor of DNA methylation 1-like n=1 Tax=Papaver somniferum TaxID=3469 RepID=UPI000E6FFA9D|nr:factor of DNA methylation 1-like [Papaver somniferum]